MNDTARRANRLLLVLAAAVALPLLAPRAASGQTYWFEQYEKAVRLIDQKRMDEATVLLNELIDRHPVPLSSLRVYGDTYVEYFPYYQSARIQLARGDLQGAAHSLDICERFGAMLQTRHGQKQIQQLRRQISEIRKYRKATGSGDD